ncbi:MAG: tetratricopeptide repeat protein, partial [Bryobacteraceae bacterium]
IMPAPFFEPDHLRHGLIGALLWLVSVSLAATGGQDIADQIRAAQSTADYPRAAKLYAELIASGEDSAEIRSNYGAMLYFAGRDREALEQLRLALKGNPKLTAPNLLAGMSLTRMGQWKDAVPYLERARLQQPSSTAPLLALGKAYVGLRDYRRAREAYVTATEMDSSNGEAWYGAGITARSLADAVLKKNREAGAESAELLRDSMKALTRAVELDPASPHGHLILAESLRDSGKFAEALAEYETVLRLSPKDAAANLGLATTYWKTGDPEKAVPHLEVVLAALPEDTEANGIMANVLVRRGDFSKALPFAQKALARNPDLAQVRFSLAKIYMEQGHTENAVRELGKIAAIDPDGTYHFLLARALRSLGRGAEAEEALAKFRQLRAASKGHTVEPE